MSEATIDFNYVNLNDIDPEMKPVPEGPYTLRLLKSTVVEGIGKNSGKPYKRYEVATQIQNDAKFSGRQVYASMFLGQKELRFLRKLMDATGIVKPEDQTLDDWFSGLAAEKPDFKALVKTEEYKTQMVDEQGQPVMKTKNTIDFGSVTVA